jgi:hypothetical protein
LDMTGQGVHAAAQILPFAADAASMAAGIAGGGGSVRYIPLHIAPMSGPSTFHYSGGNRSTITGGN